MLAPNKTVPIEESTLYKACQLFNELDSNIELTDAYKANKNKFADLSSFIDALDILYVLGKINIKKGVIEIA